MNMDVNMENANIIGSTFAIGETNVVVSASGGTALPWDDLEDGIIQAMSKLGRAAPEYEPLRGALHEVQKKNRAGFVHYIKEHTPLFLSNVTANALGATAASVIQKLLLP